MISEDMICLIDQQLTDIVDTLKMTGDGNDHYFVLQTRRSMFYI